MATQQMDAMTSFLYLTENVPSWTTQLNTLSSHTAQKNAEFVAEYSRLVKHVRPKRIKSPSTHSLHSDKDPFMDVTPVDTQDQNTPPNLPDRVEINPLEAGNRYLYAQVQRKRKPDESIRSGASGPPKFRSKHEVVIYYDSHLQETLCSMVKSIGIARNNLRKGKNALAAAQGFQLPTLSRRPDDVKPTPSLENIRHNTISRSSPMLLGSKFRITSSQRQPMSEDEAAFLTTDKSLEVVQGLCETAAHQFLRDGDCKSEINAALTQLNSTLGEAKIVLENLKTKAQEQEEITARGAARTDASATPIRSDKCLTDSDETYSKYSIEPLNIVNTKLEPTLQSLYDIKARAIVSAPAVLTIANVSSLPTADVEIEVDDASDQSEIEVNLGAYRADNAALLRAL